MRIFYYTWKENSESDIYEALTRLGHFVVKCYIPMLGYENDPEFSASLEKIFVEQKCEMFLSFDFFPLIAKSAERLGVIYAAWIYDAPHRTLYSPAAECRGTYLFLFDAVQCREMRELGLEHIYHLPLAVNTTRLNLQLGGITESVAYAYDVSFVGSLYERNMYAQISYLPDRVKGYIDGICAAQKKIYGSDLIGEVMKGEIIEELKKWVQLQIDDGYRMSEREVYADIVREKITSEERIEILRRLGACHSVTLFTASDAKLVPGVRAGGVVSYTEQMPRVFRKSRINLNMTLRSIRSGIPLRALDIMGAGGFLLTNYQPEIAEYFVAGKEVVMYSDIEELLYLTEYYLAHESEREEIAYCGWNKVCEQFSYEVQLGKMFQILAAETSAR